MERGFMEENGSFDKSTTSFCLKNLFYIDSDVPKKRKMEHKHFFKEENVMSANQEQQELKKLLSPRHIRMIALGGVIGTGIFKGSADTIGLAGPGVIFSYVFAGLLLLIVMAFS
ncbi:hypothetical protein ACEQPO_29400 [Bacillus sp. SL00103]